MSRTKLVKSITGLFKPRQTLFLVLSGAAAYLKACELRPNFIDLLFFTLSTALTVAGTTGVNMYFDRDIDSIMERTRHRYALPLGLLDPGKALAISLALVAMGLTLAAYLNFWVFLAGFLGFAIDIFLYTVLLKRRTFLSVVIGGFAGGMPALGGWSAVRGLSEEGFLFTLLIAFWSMTHIWLLAAYYKDDYRKAGIPMLPVIVGERKGVIAALLTLTLAELCVIAMYAMGVISVIGLVLTVIAYTALMMIGTSAVRGDRNRIWLSFKAASAYLGTVILGLIV